MRRAPQLQVTDDERTQLRHWTRWQRTPVRLALRAKIILLAAEGHENRHIATAVGTTADREPVATAVRQTPAGRD